MDNKKQDSDSPKKFNVVLPSVEELLEAGVQFGHETRRWNPKMAEFIFGSKDKIHVIDVTKSLEALEVALNFLAKSASEGTVIFVGTKNQASEIVRREAIRAGAYFVDQRWAGGLLTNFGVVKQSLKKLNSLEKQFEEGVEGRTKFEVSRMKKEWQNLNRLYSGIKQMENKPTAAVIIDINYEKGALRECKKLGIPVIALVDTNVNPELVNYPIPSNDDAISVIDLMMKTFADAVLEGNNSNGIKHKLVNYSAEEVKIAKTAEEEEAEKVTVVSVEADAPKPKELIKVPAKRTTKSTKATGGILERVQKENESKKKS